ncbi:MAG: hypothetical protein P9L99_11495 [Candidatus Lernaella stagnicola]|nr:hypothetical protein [Candidatus Lernaella stagnicola]
MKLRILFLLIAVCLVFGGLAGCDDDDDNNDDVADDDTNDTDDDADNDDDNVDDDTNDDDDADDDTNIDDDDDDDDDNDDDNDDTSPPPPLPPPSYGWILMDTNRDHISTVLDRAGDFDIDNVHLSHGLIMDIDEINLDEVKAQMLQEVAQEAHAVGLEVWVWAHEFYGSMITACFDPEDPMWENRRDAYRDALDRIPEIDGVVLMFGSADTEPWYVLCTCDWCEENEPTGNPLLAWMYPRQPERARMVYDAVGQVVLDEFGKKLRMRTFLHQPLEIGWLRKSLTEGDVDSRLMVMSKDVPQDWQPYYPHNPLIGDVGYRHQIIEMDLGNEYWGKGEILNSQVDYIFYRYSHDRLVGARGGAARIERGSEHALGTANEINVYAFTRLLQDEAATPDQVYREWFQQRYGIGPETPAADALKDIFRNSFYAMRKMYYTLGQWTMIKGSDIPDGARYPEQLWARVTAFYDFSWLDAFVDLVVPTEQTLRDLWQEGEEARELAGDNLAALEGLEAAFSNPDDYAELHEMLRLHVAAAEVWQLVDDTTYRFVHFTLGHPGQADYLEWNARRLLELADEIEGVWGAGAPLIAPGRIRDFVDDLRQGLAPQPGATEYVQTAQYDIAAEEIGGGEVRLTWTSSELTTQWVEWSDELPNYDNATDEEEFLATAHEVTIEASGRTVYRVAGINEAGQLIRSADFWFGLDP